jgi:hypothetical protein
VGPDCLDVRVTDRVDDLALPYLGSPLLESRYGLQAVVKPSGDELLGLGPTEHADDPLDPLVDRDSAQPGFDQVLLKGSQFQRPEIGREERPEAGAERPE